MTFDRIVIVWCVVFGAVALFGLGRYAVRGQRRGVRAAARVLRAWEPPRAGAHRSLGVPAELGFVDPLTGREVVGATRGGRYGRLEAAWPGREVEVRYAAGDPDGFRVVRGPGPPDRDLLAAAVGISVVTVILLDRLASGTGFGWILIAFGALWTAATGSVLIATVRESLRRGRALRGPTATVPGTVVAVFESKHDKEDEGGTSHIYTPVVTFTTHEGLTVLGIVPVGTSGRRTWAGREVPVRYATADPSVFHLDRFTDRSAAGCGLVFLVLFSLFGPAFTAAGAALIILG